MEINFKEIELNICKLNSINLHEVQKITAIISKLDYKLIKQLSNLPFTVDINDSLITVIDSIISDSITINTVSIVNYIKEYITDYLESANEDPETVYYANYLTNIEYID